jgi:16S rRNA processing protein RimM
VETDGYLSIGKIVGPHGINGALRVHPYAESLSIFQPGTRILLKNNQGMKKKYLIRWAKPHGKGMLFSLQGIEDRNQASSLAGCDLLMAKNRLPDLEEGTYYWFEIIGLSVYDAEEEYMGRVEAVIPTGSNDVYVVRNQENEILVPALEHVVLKIDRANGRMTVKLPEGL